MKRQWPLPYSGLPALMSGISMICFTGGILTGFLNAPVVMSILIVLGFVFGLLSAGRRIEVVSDSVVLEYGFTRTALKYTIKDIIDVFDINELSRGNLVRYFKYHLFIFNLVIVLPIIYLILKGVYPNPVYLPILFIPVFIGIVLQLYIVFTAKNYRKLIRRVSQVLSIVWVTIGFIVGMTYREVYGKSLFTDPSATILYFIGMVLLAASTIVLIALMCKHHVVIIESADGKSYAIGTSSAEDAKKLMKHILEVIAKNAEATT